ncbi:MAG: hypothetical protein HXX18_03015 [Bacteroidetes bacterium]|nr:hypothetical protein [Bacteroidota bacterium]
MKRILLIIAITILVNAISFGQKWKPEIICSTDTLTVEPYFSTKYYPKKLDTLNQKPYKIVECRTRSNIGFRFEIAVSNYYYNKKTTSWIGQHGSPNFNFILVLDKLNFGFRFKPWTINPKKEMNFNGQKLPITAKVNVIKLDFYLGYSFDFEKLISIEPFAGYNSSSLLVINEDVLNQKFTFDNTGGLIIGTTFNKYFKLKEYAYLSVFGTVGYGFVNYTKVHPDLDNGYFEWNLGIAYKGFATKRFNNKVK